MYACLEQPVIVVKFDDQLQPGIARASLRNRWTILDGRNVQEVTRQILLAHPKAAVVQVPSPASAASRLIARLRNHWAPIVTVAVAGEVNQDQEAEIRRAGASVFLPAQTDCESIEGAVESLVPGAVVTAETPAQVSVEKVILGRRIQPALHAAGGRRKQLP
ncbi:MAG: hypothetical protein ACREJO_16475 [Phycisphaerales bacterium]